MLGVPRNLIEHSLNVNPKATPKRQHLYRFVDDRWDAIKKELAKLLAAGFIREVFHPEWPSIPELHALPGSGSSAIKTLRTSKKINKGMLKQVHLNLKLMKMMKTNLYTNLLDHLTPVYIKSYNGITSLTISLGA
jgi:hypothetical protein